MCRARELSDIFEQEGAKQAQLSRRRERRGDIVDYFFIVWIAVISAVRSSSRLWISQLSTLYCSFGQLKDLLGFAREGSHDRSSE
jgi:hypothetical protein